MDVFDIIKEREEKIIKSELAKRSKDFDELTKIRGEIEEEIKFGNNRLRNWAMIITNFFGNWDRLETHSQDIFEDYEELINQFHGELKKIESDKETLESRDDAIATFGDDLEKLNEENMKMREKLGLEIGDRIEDIQEIKKRRPPKEWSESQKEYQKMVKEKIPEYVKKGIDRKEAMKMLSSVWKERKKILKKSQKIEPKLDNGLEKKTPIQNNTDEEK